MVDYAQARRNMVDSQIRTNKVVDPAILAAFSDIARERFVEPQFRAVAYLDEDLPLGAGRCMMEPMVLARLVQALAIGPEVLLLDEPTSSLDPNATESIESLIRNLTPALTVVIVTHNLAQASRVADRTIFLYNGRLVEHGETRQVFENPAQEEPARYVSGRFEFGAVAAFAAEMVRRLVDEPVPEATLINVNCPAGEPLGVEVTKLASHDEVQIGRFRLVFFVGE